MSGGGKAEASLRWGMIEENCSPHRGQEAETKSGQFNNCSITCFQLGVNFQNCDQIITPSIDKSIPRVRALMIQPLSSLYHTILWVHLNVQTVTMTFVCSGKSVLQCEGDISPQVHIFEHLVPSWHAVGKLVERLGGRLTEEVGPGDFISQPHFCSLFALDCAYKVTRVPLPAPATMPSLPTAKSSLP